MTRTRLERTHFPIDLGGQDGVVAKRPEPYEPYPQIPRDQPSQLPDCDVVDRPDDPPPTKSPFGDSNE